MIRPRFFLDADISMPLKQRDDLRLGVSIHVAVIEALEPLLNPDSGAFTGIEISIRSDAETKLSGEPVNQGIEIADILQLAWRAR